MMRVMLFSFSAVAMLLLSSCSVSTVASRIQEQPQIYASLSPPQQALVQSGNIAEGMSPSAVYLAWGSPSSSTEGNLNGVSTTRWLYSGLEPVYNPMPSPYMGCWGYGPWRNPYHCYYPYSDISYVPVNMAYVLFKNGKVVSWEKRSN